MIAAGATQLYRHFDREGRLLYVGISLSTIARLSSHKNAAPWFDQIATITVEHFPTRRLALIAELRAIRDEQPAHNVKGTEGRQSKPKQYPETDRMWGERYIPRCASFPLTAMPVMQVTEVAHIQHVEPALSLDELLPDPECGGRRFFGDAA